MPLFIHHLFTPPPPSHRLAKQFPKDMTLTRIHPSLNFLVRRTTRLQGSVIHGGFARFCPLRASSQGLRGPHVHRQTETDQSGKKKESEGVNNASRCVPRERWDGTFSIAMPELSHNLLPAYDLGTETPESIRASQTFNKSGLIAAHQRIGLKFEAFERETRQGLKAFVMVPSSPFSEPCSLPLASLLPLDVTDLREGFQFVGHCLYGTLSVDPIFTVMVSSVLEDGMGAAVRLQIFNAATSKTGKEELKRRFPKGAKVAIKQPCLERASDGTLAVRVFNPADLVVVRLPFPLQLDSCDESPQALRLEGDRLLASGDVEGAVEVYSRYISLAPKQSEAVMAYSNRAECWLRLLMYERAFQDTLQALSIDARHMKSLFRKGCALDGLRHYKQACACFQEALELAPGDEEIHSWLEKSKKHDYQSETGIFDSSLIANHADYGDYVGPVVVHMTHDGRGRGLFVTQDVKAGQLLMVINPIAVGHSGQQMSQLHVDLDTGACFPPSMEGLFTKLVSIVEYSGKALQQVYNLEEAPGSSERAPPMEIFLPNRDWASENISQVDIEKIRRIVKHNSFSVKGYSFIDPAMNKICKPDDVCGLWVLPSFTNHSCFPNARWHIYGNTMFIRATRRIHAEEEITFSYFKTLMPVELREAMTKRSWGFVCHCKRCTVERCYGDHLSHISKEFSDLHDKTVEGIQKSGSANSQSQTSAPKEFADLFVRMEKQLKKIRNLDKETQQFIRVSYALSYFSYLESGAGFENAHELIPSREIMLEAMQAIVGI